MNLKSPVDESSQSRKYFGGGGGGGEGVVGGYFGDYNRQI